jgi:hypothetical protein
MSGTGCPYVSQFNGRGRGSDLLCSVREALGLCKVGDVGIAQQEPRENQHVPSPIHVNVCWRLRPKAPQLAVENTCQEDVGCTHNCACPLDTVACPVRRDSWRQYGRGGNRADCPRRGRSPTDVGFCPTGRTDRACPEEGEPFYLSNSQVLVTAHSSVI